MQNLTNSTAWQELVNGSVIDSVITLYTSSPAGYPMGDLFWFILFFISVAIMYIKSENPLMVFIYVALGLSVMTTGLLSIKYHWLVWTISVLTLAIGLYIVFYQRNKAY